MSEWIEIALQRSTIVRGLKFAAVVGVVLVAINHGEAIVAGNIDGKRLLRMALTVAVPYLVSTFSTCGAKLEARRHQGQ
ncbi:MAG TPA: nitrate/nitrite transporter NrtS [Acidobacteriota bacterium]|nr:nitrate/nitrite transporter NrtS [Acidobacteriota bacterium]